MKTTQHPRIRPQWSICIRALTISFLLSGISWGQEDAVSLPTRATEVEGVSEYRLPNGCRALIYPDASSQVLTVNMTVLVGSRHEGYGESGMAHLLEHMLFKGTKLHPDIDRELKKLGATDMNGTTWYDRTNFYETLPASDENLDWAIGVEADRLINCEIRGEDLASEMTVVRSEFEMNENSPQKILMQRMVANAYEWHNYGKSVIGSRIDIERVPLPRLRAFYKKYYRPDNVVVVVTGKIDPQKALASLVKHFGALEVPREPLQQTYTAEPVQDGERLVYLRRSGGTPTTGVVYHIPPVAHADFAPVKVLCQVLGTEPSGFLYRELVKSGQASGVSASAMECREPGMLTVMATPKESEQNDAAVEKFARQLADVTESVNKSGLTEDILVKSKAELMKGFEDALLDSKSLAMTLSDWSAYGDWRLLFLTRDRIEKVTLSDLTRVAETYLRRSNCTIGVYLPTDAPQRSSIPSVSDMDKVVEGYRSSRSNISVSESFVATPSEVKKRLIQKPISPEMRLSILPKETRGERFHLQMVLNYGKPEDFSSRESIVAAALVGPTMMLGTSKYARDQIDAMQTKLKAQIEISSEPGKLNISIEGRKKSLKETMELAYEILRAPKFDEEELSLLKTEQLTGLMQMKKTPEMIAQIEVSRALNPVEKSNFQYSPTIAETLAELRNAKVQHIKDIYALISGSHGYATLVGAFDSEDAETSIKRLVSDWNPDAKFTRP